MKSDIPHEILEYLCNTITQITDSDTCSDLLYDLCSPQEIEHLAQRLWAAKLLMGGMTYKEVAKVMRISSATICKVAKNVKYGKGYRNILRD